MSEVRQFCPQIAGTVAGGGVVKNDWEVSAGFGGLGSCYYNIKQLDLRGLLAGNETGLYFDSISLQEAGPWTAPVASDKGWFVTYDMLTTVRPTEDTINACFERPDTGENNPPGFLHNMITANEWPPTRQTLNPSQVTWGMWRLFTPWEMGDTSSLGSAWRVSQSGFFGQGDMAVAPALFWTRIVISADGDQVIVIPSANLVTNARAEDITMPQEISAMMRAAQR